MDSVLASHTVAPGLIPGVHKNFSEFLMLAQGSSRALLLRAVDSRGLLYNID